MTKKSSIYVFNVYGIDNVRMTTERACKALGGLMWNLGLKYPVTASEVVRSSCVEEDREKLNY